MSTLFFMFIFGILEYARYLYVMHVATNAARDGARFAAVRVSQADNITATRSDIPEYPNLPVFDVPEFTTAVTARMGGAENQIHGFRVRVFPCDPEGLYQDPIVVRPKNSTQNSSLTWNSAVFSERIAVRIDGEYRVLLPSLLIWRNTLPVQIVSLAASEG